MLGDLGQKLLPETSKSCPKCYKSPNMVTLFRTHLIYLPSRLFFHLTSFVSSFILYISSLSFNPLSLCLSPPMIVLVEICSLSKWYFRPLSNNFSLFLCPCLLLAACCHNVSFSFYLFLLLSSSFYFYQFLCLAVFFLSVSKPFGFIFSLSVLRQICLSSTFVISQHISCSYSNCFPLLLQVACSSYLFKCSFFASNFLNTLNSSSAWCKFCKRNVPTKFERPSLR